MPTEKTVRLAYGRDAVVALGAELFSVPGGSARRGRHDPAAGAHALNRGACAGIAVVVSSSRKPPDWCSHSLA
jgi:hypothetical protein